MALEVFVPSAGVGVVGGMLDHRLSGRGFHDGFVVGHVVFGGRFAGGASHVFRND